MGQGDGGGSAGRAEELRTELAFGDRVLVCRQLVGINRSPLWEGHRKKLWSPPGRAEPLGWTVPGMPTLQPLSPTPPSRDVAPNLAPRLRRGGCLGSKGSVAATGAGVGTPVSHRAADIGAQWGSAGTCSHVRPPALCHQTGHGPWLSGLCLPLFCGSRAAAWVPPCPSAGSQSPQLLSSLLQDPR